MALTKVSRGLLSTGIVDNSTTTAITIDSSENVGIGVSNPSDYYANNLVVTGPSEGGITIASTGTHTNYLLFADSSSGVARYAGMVEYAHSIDQMAFRTNSIQRMRIDSSGNVSIANTVATSSFSAAANNLVVGSGSGQQGMTIYGGSESNIFFADGTGANAYVGRIEYSHGLNSLYFYANNTFLMNLSTSGYFFPQLRSSSAANNDLRYNTANGEIYYQTSSERYKSNIADLEFDTSNLYNLRPVSFDDNETGERCFGLIAEETFEQIPEAVVTRDIDGETVPDSIPYSMLSVVIINEMKKLKVENNLLKERIEALENN